MRPRSSASRSSLRHVVGLHAAREALKVHPRAIKEIWLKEGGRANQDLQFFVDWCKEAGVPLRNCSDSHLNRWSQSHQGVCVAVAETPEWDWDLVAKPEDRLVLILDGIMDPHNLGAIMRTAWLAGAYGLILAEHRSAPLTSSAMKVASGAAEHLAVLGEGSIGAHIRRLKEQGFWVFGLSASENKMVWNAELKGKVAWVVGAEDRGLRSGVSKECDELLSIPQIDASASYNASVAVAMALMETLRQAKNP